MPLLLVTATAFAVTACSSSHHSDGPVRHTGLQQAMSEVSGSGPAQRYFEYGNLARLRALGVITPRSVTGQGPRVEVVRWQAVAGLGLGRLAGASAQLPATLGLNPYAANSAVTIGLPPDAATRIDGNIDAKVVTAKLTALGARSRSFGAVSGLSLGADNRIDLNPSLTQLGFTSELDQSIVHGSSAAFAPNAGSLVSVTTPGTALLDSGQYAKVADCLGDVVAAEIVAGDASAPVTVVAVGVRDPGTLAGAVHEVVCYLPANGKAASVRATVQKNLTTTGRSASGVRLDTLISAARTDAAGPLVRSTLTIKPGVQAGVVFHALADHDIDVWDGSCTDPTGRAC